MLGSFAIDQTYTAHSYHFDARIYDRFIKFYWHL